MARSGVVLYRSPAMVWMLWSADARPAGQPGRRTIQGQSAPLLTGAGDSAGETSVIGGSVSSTQTVPSVRSQTAIPGQVQCRATQHSAAQPTTALCVSDQFSIQHTEKHIGVGREHPGVLSYWESVGTL